MENLGTFQCFTCGEFGHLKASCPQQQTHPAVTAPGQPAPYTRRDTIECPVCQRDWVAKFTSPHKFLDTQVCPWCRIFEIAEDGAVIRRNATQPPPGWR